MVAGFGERQPAGRLAGRDIRGSIVKVGYRLVALPEIRQNLTAHSPGLDKPAVPVNHRVEDHDCSPAITGSPEREGQLDLQPEVASFPVGRRAQLRDGVARLIPVQQELAGRGELVGRGMRVARGLHQLGRLPVMRQRLGWLAAPVGHVAEQRFGLRSLPETRRVPEFPLGEDAARAFSVRPGKIEFPRARANSAARRKTGGGHSCRGSHARGPQRIDQPAAQQPVVPHGPIDLAGQEMTVAEVSEDGHPASGWWLPRPPEVRRGCPGR